MALKDVEGVDLAHNGIEGVNNWMSVSPRPEHNIGERFNRQPDPSSKRKPKSLSFRSIQLTDETVEYVQLLMNARSNWAILGPSLEERCCLPATPLGVKSISAAEG